MKGSLNMDELNKNGQNGENKEIQEENQILNESQQEETQIYDENLQQTQESGTQTVEIVGKEEKPKINYKKEILDWVFTLGLAVVIALLIRNFVFTLVLVDGDSMYPTLHDGDRLVVSRLPYTPKNGDIIIFKPKSNPKKVFVKRVIATEGQTIYIDYAEGKVYVDGVAIDEPYIKEKMNQSPYFQQTGPQVVPENCVFVMGDNRNNSHDSRASDIGMVDRKSILGKAVLRFWPINKFEVLKHAN